MFLRGVFRDVPTWCDELEFDLERSVAEYARQLCFCFDLRRHEIEKQNVQRADILGYRTRFCHDEDVLLRQRLRGGELVWYLDRHRGRFLVC